MPACLLHMVAAGSLWLFSHESKVRNLNYHSNCTIWITQCTHERSNCDIWITQCTCTRETEFGFSIPEREKNVWVPCQSNVHGARISCASVHVQCAVYRRKWLVGHVAPPPPPQSQFRGQGIHTVMFPARFERCITGKHLRIVIWNAQFNRDIIWRTHGPKYRHLNDNSNCAIQMII